jgi:hypothetical protein
VADRPSVGDVTRLLREWKDGGSADAEAALFTLVETELVKVADAALRKHPSRARKIDPRELVNEAYLAVPTNNLISPNSRSSMALDSSGSGSIYGASSSKTRAVEGRGRRLSGE